MPADPQVLDVAEFAVDAPRHLRASWQRGAPMVVAVDGQERVRVDTIQDLETLHAALEARPGGSR